jgi:hypothetical protein
LFVGLALSEAWGGAQQQQPLPPLQILVKGDPAFEPLARGIRNGIPALGKMLVDEKCDETFPTSRPCPEYGAISECGATIAKIFINPDPRLAAARSYDEPPFIGLIGTVRSLDDSNHLLGKAAPLPKGDYPIWMAEAGKLGIQPPPEIPVFHWFTLMAAKSPDGTFDIRAIFYYPDDKFRTPEQWLLSATPRNGIPSTASTIPDSIWSQCCDLTVRHLSVTAHKISPPCMVPPCPPPWWDIIALATVANIGQIAVKEPFTVRVLLNGRLIHEEEIAELAAGASQPILAAAMVDKPGIYIVTVIVDPADKIKERDETNNIAERSVNIQ